MSNFANKVVNTITHALEATDIRRFNKNEEKIDKERIMHEIIANVIETLDNEQKGEIRKTFDPDYKYDSLSLFLFDRFPFNRYVDITAMPSGFCVVLTKFDRSYGGDIPQIKDVETVLEHPFTENELEEFKDEFNANCAKYYGKEDEIKKPDYDAIIECLKEGIRKGNVSKHQLEGLGDFDAR